MKGLTKKQQDMFVENVGLLHGFYYTKISHARKMFLGRQRILDALADSLMSCVVSFNPEFVCVEDTDDTPTRRSSFSSYAYKSFMNKLITLNTQQERENVKELEIFLATDLWSFDSDKDAHLFKIPAPLETEKPKIDEKALLACIDSAGLLESDKKILLTRYLSHGGAYTEELLKDLKMTKQNVYKRSHIAAKKVNDYMKKNGIHYDDFIIK